MSVLACSCMQTIIRITTKLEPNYSRPLHAIASCHCITKSSRWSSNNIFEARALFICLLHGVHVAANKMSYGSYFVFLGCFQDVTTSDPIQVKDILLRKWCIDMFGELEGTESRISKKKRLKCIQKWHTPRPICSRRQKVLPSRHILYGKNIAFPVPALSLKNAFGPRLPQNMQAQEWKLHQFCETSSKHVSSRFDRQSRQLLPLLLLATATPTGYCYWLPLLLQLQTGYWVLLLLLATDTATATATGYSYCYLLLLSCCKAGQKFVYPKFFN